MDGETDDTEDFGDVPAAVPADLDLDSTVKNLTGNASSMLSRGQAAFDKQEAERPEVAGRIQQHLDESDKLLAQMQDKKFDAQKPEFKVPDFKAPDPQYDPAASFASSASVMGLLASAFTRAPLKNALNASTAVMQAGQQQDKTAYDRAFSEFQQAKDTALKHVDFEKSMYQLEQNAFQFDVNKGLSMAQAHRAAAGDEKALFLLRNDPKEYMEMGKNYITAADNFTKSFNGLEDYQIKTQDKQIEDRGVAEAKQAAMAAGKPWTAMDEANTRDDIRDLLVTKRTSRAGGGTGSAMNDEKLRVQAEFNSDMDEANKLTDPTARETAKQAAIEKRDSGLSALRGTPAKGADALLADWVSAQKAAGHEPTAEEKINQRQKIMKGGLSGNKTADIEQKVDQYDDSLDLIDGSLAKLNKYWGVAGAAGRIRRGGEILENIFGGNKTDFEQFKRDISSLQAAAPQLLFGRNGRPLSSEAGQIKDIIGGLNFGDTTANTVRSLQEIKRRMMQMKRDNELKLNGTWKPRQDRESAAPVGGGSAWQDAPVVGEP